MHRILSTNSFLYKCKLKETHLCSFCNETKETIDHLFWVCHIVKSFWFEINDFLKTQCHFHLTLSAQNVLIGSPIMDKSEISLFIILKFYIYKCKIVNTSPTVEGAINMIKDVYKIEKMSNKYYNSPAVADRNLKKWNCISQIL